ncbi:uncharacterized protein RCC_02389 [Ramularia collo-cygni]|uniref:Rhodopsin domain-containing protein n=1 Tax=Ramularia collo-cygni TaxID=112498 RepID=A0A2D3US81_9PEZI|nr:uncharacterized protein RCC_02389 [Ramularia collo-cygni]CZT16555.1 uncharacterized protein RCC_02389 [Ramularia collo-cygni]
MMSSNMMIFEELEPRAAKILANQNRGLTLAVVTWLLLGFSAITLCARCWCKFKHARQLYYDDVIMLIAFLNGIVYSVMVQLNVSKGYGQHIGSLSQVDMIDTVLLGSLVMLFGALSAMAGRISFCCTLMFLIKTDPRIRTWHVYVCIVFQLALNVTGIIVLFTQCGRTLDHVWEGEQSSNYYDFCSNPTMQTYLKYAVGAGNASTDLYLAILPAILISHTKTSLKAKLGMASLLCLSALALVAASAKTYEAKVLQNITDFTFTLVPYTLCTSIELNIIIISASIPLLRPLFRRQKPPKVSLSGNTWPEGGQISLGSLQPSQSEESSMSEIKREDSKTSLARSQNEGITVTTVIDVASHERSAPVVHANLIGLVSDSDYIRYPDTTGDGSARRRRCW